MKHLFKALIALSIVISNTACNDEVGTLKKGNQSSMLIFENQDDFQHAVSESVEIPVAELEEWSRSKGIKSFGVEALKRYKSINFDELSSQEELLSIIEENNAYLVLKEIQCELYLETKYHNRADRFLINQDRLVQIGDKVHKIFKQGEVKGSLDEIESLRAISEEQFDQALRTISEEQFDQVARGEKEVTINGLEIIPSESFTTDPIITDCGGTGGGGTGGGGTGGGGTGGNCGDLQERSSTSDRDRTISRAKIEMKWSASNTKYYINVELLVRPYKKTLGIWYWCTRTITAEATFDPRRENGLTVIDQPYTYGRETVYDSKWERKWREPNGTTFNNNPYFHSIYMYGDTPSTPPASFNCN